jgi:hypothetical protein
LAIDRYQKKEEEEYAPLITRAKNWWPTNKKKVKIYKKNGDETILKREMSFEGKLFIDIPNELNKKEIL